METRCRASGRTAPQGWGLATPSWPPGHRGDRGSDDQTPEGDSPAESAALRGTETAQVAPQGERQRRDASLLPPSPTFLEALAQIPVSRSQEGGRGPGGEDRAGRVTAGERALEPPGAQGT